MKKHEESVDNVVGEATIARAPSGSASRDVAVAVVAGVVLLWAGSAAEPEASVRGAGLRLRRRFLGG